MKRIFSKFEKNPLAKSGMIVFLGTLVTNALAYLYHLLMGRLLGPVGYGELSSLFSLLYIINVPILVGQTVLIKFVSSYKANDEIGKTKALLIMVTKYFIMGSLLLLPLVLYSSPYITEFLHLKSNDLFVLVYGMVVFSLLGIAMASVLQGYQMFVWSSILSVFSMVFRVSISIPMAGLGVSGVMWAALISALLVYILYFYPLKFLLPVQSKSIEMKFSEALTYTIPTFITLLGITSIYSTDIMLVRHYFNASDAGLYAALAVLGKIIFYASSAITTVLFPIIAEKTASGKKMLSEIRMAIGIVSMISLALCVLFFMFPGFIVRALFGNAYSHASGLLGFFGIFLAIFSVGNSLAMSCLAAGKTKVWIFAATASIVQIIGIVYSHEHIIEVIWLNIAVSILFAVGSGIYLYRSMYEKI